jgi:hypothetical protein
LFYFFIRFGTFFTHKIVNKLSEIWGLGSKIRDTEKNRRQSQDPRVKKAPDPGSGSATLQLTLEKVRAPQTTAHRYSCGTVPPCLDRKPISSFMLFIRCTVLCTVEDYGMGETLFVVQVALLVFCRFLENGKKQFFTVLYIIFFKEEILLGLRKYITYNVPFPCI